MPNYLNIKLDCKLDTFKLTHDAKDDLSFRKFLDIIEFLKKQGLGDTIWDPKSSILFECEIDDTRIVHSVDSGESFGRLLKLIEFIRSQYFDNTYSMFNIHTVVYVNHGEFAGKFGVISNVYHEFVDQADYDIATLCLDIGDKTVWVNAEDVELADKVKVLDPAIKEENSNPIVVPSPAKVTQEENILLSDIDAIITESSGVIELPPAQIPVNNPEENPASPLIGKLVKLVSTGKESASERGLLGKPLKIMNYVDGDYALQYGNDALIWRSREKFEIEGETNPPFPMSPSQIKRDFDISHPIPLPDQEPVIMGKFPFPILSEPEKISQPPVQNENDTGMNDDELAVIMKCSTAKEAIEAHRKAFPESDRSYQSIQVNHTLNKKREKEKERSQKPPEEEWAIEQTDFLKQHLTRDDVLEKFREKFPASTHKDYPILQLWDSFTRYRRDSGDGEKMFGKKLSTDFKKDRMVKAKPGVVAVFSGEGKIKRVNLISGDILVDFSNGTEWVKGDNYELIPLPEGEVKP